MNEDEAELRLLILTNRIFRRIIHHLRFDVDVVFHQLDDVAGLKPNVDQRPRLWGAYSFRFPMSHHIPRRGQNRLSDSFHVTLMERKGVPYSMPTP